MKYPKSVIEMQKELGVPYEIKNIDCEPCLYRNFKNGFDLEICGVYSRRRKQNRRIFICLWQVKRYFTIVAEVSEIPYNAQAIHTVAEMLYAYSNKLLAEAHNVIDNVKVKRGRLTYEEFISQEKFQGETKCQQEI